MAEKLDCKGLRCPLPIVEITKKIATMEVGEELVIESNDPGFPPDIKAWCTATRNTLRSLEDQGGTYYAVVEKR